MIYWMNPLWFSAYNKAQVSQIFLIAVTNTFLFPALSVFLIWKLGFMKSIEMMDAKERLIPFIAAGVFYIWAYVVLRKSGLPQILNVTVLGATITLFAIFMLNLFWKVSIHTAAMGCWMIITLLMCFFTGGSYSLLLVAIVILGGIIGSCRILLKAHSVSEIFIGYFVGMMGMIVALRFY